MGRLGIIERVFMTQQDRGLQMAFPSFLSEVTGHRLMAAVLSALILHGLGIGTSVCLGQGGQDAASSNTKLDSPIMSKPDLFKPLTEPPCSYCVNQNRKGFVNADDPVIAWIRGAHNGGAIPMRHFLAAPRVINDTYGLFFFDADGGYVSAFKKDYGYKFHGWRGGVMVVEDKDGSLWSALTGLAISGPSKGKRLERVPSMKTTWSHWLMLHPESTAYDMFDGKKYPMSELPTEISADAKASMGKVDDRLAAESLVMGLEGGKSQFAIDLTGLQERACFRDQVDGQTVAVFWYGPTRSAVVFESTLDGKSLTFYADEISPETAPFKDKETGTRWTLAGRGVDGPLKGKELNWFPSIQCRWYAWSHEYPQTRLRKSEQPAGDSK
ncbi:MAG: DUF3179 domain-containing (seleno)protein [Verrucomicrobiales bacterium]